MSPLQSTTVLVGRILLGVFFVMSGFEKITGFSGTVGYIAAAGLPLANVVAVLTIAAGATAEVLVFDLARTFVPAPRITSTRKP